MNAALLGYGFAGHTFHAPLLRTTRGLKLTTVVTSRAVDLPGVTVVRDAAAAIADPTISLVVVATPNPTHYELARRALEAGKHVVVDKPFTITAGEAEQLIALARRAGRLLSVFQNRRWDGDFLTVQRLLAASKLGALSHFESHYDRYRPTVLDRWRDRDEPGSGIWYDLGAHLVDQALVLFGPPDSLTADLERQRPGAAAIDYFHVVLRYGTMRAVLHGSCLTPAPLRRFEIHGTQASFVTQGMDAQEEALKRGELPGSPGWGDNPQAGVCTGAEGTVTRVPILPGNYPAYYEGIRDAILHGGPNPVPAEAGLAVMRIIEAGMRG